MSSTDAEFLESLKTARDAVVAGLSSGRRIIEYTIGGDQVITNSPTETLKVLEEQIALYTRKVNASGRGLAYNLARRRRSP